MFGLATFRSYIANAVAHAGTDIGFSEDLEPYARSFSGLMNQLLAYVKIQNHDGIKLGIKHPFDAFHVGGFSSADHWLLIHCRYVRALLIKLLAATGDQYYNYLECGLYRIIGDIEKSGEVPVNDDGGYQQISDAQKDVLIDRINGSEYSDETKTHLTRTVQDVFDILSQHPYRNRSTSVGAMWHILPHELPDESLVLDVVAVRYGDIALILEDPFYDWMTALTDGNTVEVTTKEVMSVEEPMLSVDQLQAKTLELCTTAFGNEMALGLHERTQRFAEEALELLQACDVPKSMILNAVEYVYNRDKGDPAQEVGGTHTTLMALCNALGISLQEAAIEDIKAFEKNARKIGEKRKRKPDFYADYNDGVPTIKPEA